MGDSVFINGRKIRRAGYIRYQMFTGAGGRIADFEFLLFYGVISIRKLV
ncbi:hypothetical protein [Snodgrassella gandavensis]|nr:hypothetical protein [Snodgrassella gandavensis]